MISNGMILEVLATDRNAVRDFSIFCKKTGNQLISWEETDGILRFQIRKVS